MKKFKVIVPALNLINLHIPNYLQSSVLPDEAKLIANKRLGEFYIKLKEELPENRKYMAESIHEVLNFMNQNTDPALLKSFMDINTKMDSSKAQSLQESIPELYDLVVKNLANS